MSFLIFKPYMVHMTYKFCFEELFFPFQYSIALIKKYFKFSVQFSKSHHCFCVCQNVRNVKFVLQKLSFYDIIQTRTGLQVKAGIVKRLHSEQYFNNFHCILEQQTFGQLQKGKFLTQYIQNCLLLLSHACSHSTKPLLILKIAILI